MASNELTSALMAAADLSGAGRSILDQSLREVLLRAAGRPEPHQYLSGSWLLGGNYQPMEAAVASLLEHGRAEPYDIDLVHVLERERSDVASVARFGHRVECASLHMYVAFDKAHVVDFELPVARNVVKPTHGISVWYYSLVNTTFNRYRELKCALLHKWSPPVEVEPLTYYAFRMLSEITPVESQLRDLFVKDRPRAFHELTRHLDLVADQLKAAIELAGELETIASDDASEEEARLKAVQTELLGKAGKSLSLTEAAKQLGVSRQALHKRIGLGTALGLMRGSELVVPEAQFVIKNRKVKIVDGLGAVMREFDASGAGRWSALQFLIEVDPTLQRTPLETLKAGEQDAAVRAARAYLSLDEA
ncbi:hypothetical protein [Mesorhizobium sp. M0488]|uniref:hypothetical protein n=1 Tax=unclassified Mesorhizobium TaxID=325217 RepID=UPI00333D2C01